MTTTPTTDVTVSRRGSAETATVPAHRLAETLLDCNRDAPPEVIEAVKGLAEAVVTGKYFRYPLQSMRVVKHIGGQRNS